MKNILLIGTIFLSGCSHGAGWGTRDVTIESVKIVCLSHKDTQGTKDQVTENNGVLKALGAPPVNCKK